jgi:NAD-dependent DNA ligase
VVIIKKKMIYFLFSQGIFKIMSQKTKLLNKLQSMDAQYHHQTNPSSEDNDQEYDNLREVYEEHFEESYPHVGAPVPKDRRCLLPFYMGSLDKVTADKKDLLDKWRLQNPVPSFVLQTKLDGISALYVLKFHQKPRLYTRGDGKEGTDISHLVPLLASSLPSPNFKEGEELVVRGEIIMSHSMFQKKYSKTFKNSRNLVSGIVHSKTPSPDLLQDICFIVYEDLSRPRCPMDQIDALQKWGFQTVFCKRISASILSLELLEKEWADWRQ